ncbi:SbcC/MukB-like Walker B domain-containing protein [Actinomadura luteofluorescens]|uniref:SbcC/MukB-like Walker B domain-containing protein n=1 Tax=Actinomadura luteofluorescens TaxID=46163 RepID=UPI00346C449E
MSPAANPLHPVTETAVLGVPGAEGRWQPTRAGAINSWAWSDEVLFFAGGWLALAGPNGSGKSLTASMLITVLLDAEISQKALSVSGKASGTLASRHTDRNEQEDRTGLWWLEYGYRDEHTGQTRYMTTGMWLRSTGGKLQRAFFIVPGRVGHELTLRRDRTTVKIDDLGGQLAALGGRLFLSSAVPRSALAGVPLSLGDEHEFRDAVRNHLFAPLNEIQFEALVGVLRSLRSVRTAEAISPKEMRQVLTDALPALEPDRLKVVADAMARISELEKHLDQSRKEARLLAQTDKHYRSYRSAVAQLQAAELAAANNAYDEQTRQARQASHDLERAQATAGGIQRRLSRKYEGVSRLEGELSAAEGMLRDHAGAELPLREERAAELDDTAADAEAQAEQAATDAGTAMDGSAESASRAHQAQGHLLDFAERLRQDGEHLGAASATDRMISVYHGLCAAEPHTEPPAVDLDELCATPLAWTEARTGKVARVRAALRLHGEAQTAERTLAQGRQEAETGESVTREALEGATRDRQEAETVFLDELGTWSGRLRHLRPPPPDLCTPDQAAENDRLPADRIRRWLSEEVAAASLRIDLTGHRERAATAEALMNAAEGAAADAHAAHRRALGAVREEEGGLLDVQAENAAAEQTDQTELEQARADHHREITDAGEAERDAWRRRSDAAAAALQAARDWLAGAHRWRTALAYLDPGAIPLPEPSAPLSDEALREVEPASVRLAAHKAHAAAAAELHHQVAEAREVIKTIEAGIEELRADVVRARRTAPVPPAPQWRSRSADDGVPLWAVVDFAGHLPAEEADRLEGALLASGLLDALIRPDGRPVAGDLVLTPTASASHRTLADFLQPDAQDGGSAEAIHRLLRSIPVDSPAPGALRNGVLTAACPEGYQAAYIGRTARERARRQRLTDLEQRLAEREQELRQADQELSRREGHVLAAAAERDALPRAEALFSARHDLVSLTHEHSIAERQAGQRTAQADLALQQVMTTLRQRSDARSARLDRARQSLEHAERTARSAGSAAAKAEENAVELRRSAQGCETARLEAARAQEEADGEQNWFPHSAVNAVRNAHSAEDRAQEALIRAETAAIDAAEKHDEATRTVRSALGALNKAAALPDGSLLPTSHDALDNHAGAVGALELLVRDGRMAALRCTELMRAARRDHQTAAMARATAARMSDRAGQARAKARKAVAAVETMRRLYGAEYDDLLTTKNRLSDQLGRVKSEIETLRTEKEEADKEQTRAEVTLENVAPQRRVAEQQRDRCVRTLGRLIDEGLATLPDGITADPSGRPAHLTAALEWSRLLLADRHAHADRHAQLVRFRDRALKTVENSARDTSGELARFNRQVMLVSIEGTEWRRAVVAEPDSVRGEDLSDALASLEASIALLEEDLRDDFKQAMRTGMFTRLRKDIQIRREAARELVRQIRETLDGVRTGVANVGIQVDWDVRKEDEDAVRMIKLIEEAPTDRSFEEMYTVLRQRMDAKVDEPWPDRVAHTFDYRSWHEWDIFVTHSSFGDGSSNEAFRKVGTRSNPLETLSTGERRLATMLPLLAAAWSMYSGDYRGPRLLSIDEIDAAFDEPNLRQVLALLRSWDFDVLATTPSITPMIKREAGRAMVHQVVASGRNRITIPWLWEGHGEPRPVTLDGMA